MKILKETVKDVSNEFDEFEAQLDDADYVVSVLAKTFNYEPEGNKPFDIENLKSIFGEQKKQIKGSLQRTTLDKALEKISKYLSYATYLYGIQRDEPSGLKIVSQDKLQERNNKFWNIINKCITIPPKEVIEHIPERPSYFGNFLIWGFCYVYLNNDKGIVIYCWAED